MKGNDEVIKEFNELVNMTATDLEKWLKSDDSNSAGWPKEDENGETVGHDSGRKIVEILKDNPNKDSDKYTDEQVQHMRKVVSYCKRHLAQESKGNSEKSAEEVKKTKSYASLKNWGHDFLKAQDKSGGDDKEEEEEEEEDDQAEEDEDDGDDKQAGDKRRTTRSQSGANKKRETSKGQGTKKKNDDDEDEDDKDEEEYQEEDEDEEEEENEDEQDDDDEDNKKSNGKKSNGSGKKGPKKGDTVSWNWGNGQPKGKVLEVKEDKATITTKNGNKVSRDGDAEDPAVVLDAGKSKAIKSNHELNETED